MFFLKRMAMVAVFALFGGALLAPSAKATLTFDLNTANISGLTGPYAMADVTLVDATHASILFTALNDGTYFYPFIDGGAAAVNVNAPTFTLSIPTYTSVPGFGPPTFDSWGSGNNNGWGNFAARLKNGDGSSTPASTIAFIVTNTGGTWSSESDVLTPNNAGVKVSAHQSPCLITDCTGTIGTPATFFSAGRERGSSEPPPTEIPEPAGVAATGIGFAALGLIRRQRKRSKSGDRAAAA